ncbi:MAG: response regulator transcription factor [bacterium]|nr:response regulator transcription factor [bacterium]
MRTDVLMVDDEEALASSTCEYLTTFGVTATAVTTAEEALEFLQHNEAALILLDVNLPGMNGFEFCRTVRRRAATPILFISARDSDDDQILALGVGGDDYIAKPYSLAVLHAKVRRILDRHATEPIPPTPGYDDGRLRLDPEAERVWVDGKEVPTTALEYRLLAHLVANRGRVVPKREIFEKVWGDAITGDGTLTVHIRRLRTKIEADPDNPRHLRTVWGRGYLFEGREP